MAWQNKILNMTNKINETKLNYLYINNTKYSIVFYLNIVLFFLAS